MHYYKIHAGKQNKYASLALKEGFIGLDFDLSDLSKIMGTGDFKDTLKNLYQEKNSGLSKAQIASGVGHVFRFISKIEEGDKILLPLGDGTYKVGDISSQYFYAGEGQPIPHRRSVAWYGTLDKEKFSDSLRNSIGAIGTISDITNHSVEIEALLSGDTARVESVQSMIDQSEFALEKHLEDFIIENWNNLDLGKDYDLFRNEDGEIEAKQYRTDVGPIDILAIKKDKTEILILELKKGRSGDAVVGQTLRYITAVRKELAEQNQNVRAIIITGSDDRNIRYSLEAVKEGLIEFMVYSVQFSLKKI